jgi:hypothetical protein
MGRTARRVLGTGSIAVLLGLTAAEVVAAPAAGDAITKPSLPLPGSPHRSVEPAAAPRAAEERTSMRGFVELIALVVACAAVIAYYSVTAGERGGTRVPARVRRR